MMSALSSTAAPSAGVATRCSSFFMAATRALDRAALSFGNSFEHSMTNDARSPADALPSTVSSPAVLTSVQRCQSFASRSARTAAIVASVRRGPFCTFANVAAAAAGSPACRAT